jgi:hypothetical protein
MVFLLQLLGIRTFSFHEKIQAKVKPKICNKLIRELTHKTAKNNGKFSESKIKTSFGYSL